MRLYLKITVFIAVISCFGFYQGSIVNGTKKINEDSLYVVTNYVKYEYQIKMRDGIKLFTSVYIPKDSTKKYPMLMVRTPYSVAPYGTSIDKYAKRLGPSKKFMKEGFIFVYQDVRGRYMSEGYYNNMTPYIENKKSKKDIDESSDTYDAIDWLIKNVKGNNGKVGQWGISYPGFYTAAGIVDAHPALKASSPQGVMTDIFFDDFHHYGAFYLHCFSWINVFGYPKDSITTQTWYPLVDMGTPDGYRFLMELGPLKNVNEKYFKGNNVLWNEFVEHPNYDEYFQKRNILPHLKNVKHAVMTVGGWFDTDDLYGTLNTYKSLEKQNPQSTYNTIVMGPWRHGGWARDFGPLVLGDIYFGDSISDFYNENILFPFFNFYLKEEGALNLPEAYMFETGTNKWRTFEKWPPAEVKTKSLYFHANGNLSFDKPVENEFAYSEYVSDPNKPVPFTRYIEPAHTVDYLTEDQRFAGCRPDVLVFETNILEEDVTIGGEIFAKLKVSTTGTDADWVVKLIDVYPGDYPNHAYNIPRVRMQNYEQLVRAEIIRGRFRNSLEKPEPFVPNQITDVNFQLQDVLHTFKKGHRIMVQVQSTWFPLADRNPQKYVDNIFKANAEDFIKATHRVYHSTIASSHLVVGVLN